MSAHLKVYDNIEISLYEDTMFFTLQCTDSVSDSQLPTVQYNFRHIADLENIEPNQLVGELTCTKKSMRSWYKHNLNVLSRPIYQNLSIGDGFVRTLPF